jgi:outer membrane protein assembly factor BamD
MRLFLIVTTSYCAICAGTLQAGLVWRPGEGWVSESGDTVQASSAKTQLDVARDLEAKESYKEALAAYRALARRWPLSIYTGEAQFKIGLMQEKMADFWNAYKSYQVVVKKHPGSQFFELAIERMFAIGNLYLSGEPQRLWKIPLLPSMDKTVEIYDAVIKAAPYGKMAPAAYFQMGQARERQGKWSDAITAYTTILDKYPGSEYADDAQYQIGYAWFKAASQPEYDQSAGEKSIEAFEDFLVRYPRSEKVAQAREHIESLRGRITQGAFNIARFYENQKNHKAAFIYYNEVVRQSPDSAQGREAKERIEFLRPLVEGTGSPQPPAPPATGTSSQVNGDGPGPLASTPR